MLTAIEAAVKRVKEVLPYSTVENSLDTIVGLLLDGFEKDLIEEGRAGLVADLSRKKSWKNLRAVK